MHFKAYISAFNDKEEYSTSVKTKVIIFIKINYLINKENRINYRNTVKYTFFFAFQCWRTKKYDERDQNGLRTASWNMYWTLKCLWEECIRS